MRIQFTKVVGSGNDFIIIDNRDGKLGKNISGLAESLCRRKLSIGSDGLLVLENSKKADFKMRVFNPDGSEVTMCGNGARCFALYCNVQKLCRNKMVIETGAGLLNAEISGIMIKLKMTDPKNIEMDKDLDLGAAILKTHFINTGVPHVVHFLGEDDDIDSYPVKNVGIKIRHHKAFMPEGTNANFVKLMSKNKIKIRTYERGVEDETLACGTGAVASAIISNLVNDTQAPTEVLTKSGEILKVYFAEDKGKIREVYLEGQAKIVYEGVIYV